MAVTEDLPLAVLTSFDKDHPELRQLPSEVVIISLDKTFEDDLAVVIAHFSLACAPAPRQSLLRSRRRGGMMGACFSRT